MPSEADRKRLSHIKQEHLSCHGTWEKTQIGWLIAQLRAAWENNDQAFLAGWCKAFKHCNPDVGCDFGANPDTAEKALKVWHKEKSDAKRLEEIVDYVKWRGPHLTLESIMWMATELRAAWEEIERLKDGHAKHLESLRGEVRSLREQNEWLKKGSVPEYPGA